MPHSSVSRAVAQRRVYIKVQDQRDRRDILLLRYTGDHFDPPSFSREERADSVVHTDEAIACELQHSDVAMGGGGSPRSV